MPDKNRRDAVMVTGDTIDANLPSSSIKDEQQLTKMPVQTRISAQIDRS
jgi:hypothetical protein